MRFKTLRLENFMSFGKTKLDMTQTGLILLTGLNKDNPACNRNGSGKSALWDGLCWVLYGRTIRDIPLDKIRNRWTNKGTRVWVSLEDEDNEWVIERTRGVKSNPTLDLYWNGKNISASTATNTQKKIELLLGMDYGTFCTAILFGQDTLRFARLTDKERKAVLEKLLGLEIYEKACNLARQEQAGLKLTLDLHHASYSKAKERLEEYREKLREAKKKLNEDQEQVRASIRKNEAMVDEIRLRLKKYSKKAHKRGVRLEALRHVVDSREARLTRMASFKEQYTELSEQIREIQAKIVSVKDEKKPLCPTCEQTIHDKSKKKVIRSLEEERSQLLKKMNKADRRYKKLGAKLNKGKMAHLKYTRLLKKSEKLKAFEYAESRKLNSLQLQISYAKKTPVFSQTALDEIRSVLKQTKKELGNSKADAQRLSRKIERAKFWIEGFGQHGLRSYLMDEVIPFLNERANYYGRLLAEGRVKIRFKTYDETPSGKESDRLTILAKNKDGSDVYGGNSAGERQRIDLCVALALKDLARSRGQAKIDLMVFDEVFENLDDAGCERVISLLNQEKESLGSCFVITHNEGLKPYFSNRIEVVKEGKISKCLEN